MRDVGRANDNTSQDARPRLSPLLSLDVCDNRLSRLCALNTWTHCVWYAANDEEGLALHSSKGWLPAVRDCYSCGGCQNSHTRVKVTLTYIVLNTRFPERRYPGKFDLWSSHSIFHTLVACAAVIQLMGYLAALDFAHANLTCSSLSRM